MGGGGYILHGIRRLKEGGGGGDTSSGNRADQTFFYIRVKSYPVEWEHLTSTPHKEDDHGSTPEPFFGDTRFKNRRKGQFAGTDPPGNFMYSSLSLPLSSTSVCVRSGKSHDNITRIPNFARTSFPRSPSFGFDPKISVRSVIARFGKVLIRKYRESLRRIDEKLRENQSQFHRGIASAFLEIRVIIQLALKRLVFDPFNV